MGARESDPGRLTCVVRGRASITEASLAARAFGEAQWLTEDECARLCIIIEELVANLFDHAALSDADAVALTLASEPDGIRIVIVDPGAPFDPREAPSPRERPERGGGAGIDLVRAWAQIVDYAQVPEGNRLELLLPIGG
jgi:anti-sigma regulatory factor (Ser/Thr protein kinase)